ncbi:hypothetical protein BXZ70DRAFT_29279 [Cristinia sonorae]|uniref:Uncharacterized protein n=1 Tax=Cristinia sonorae TaxID=1940300 RepID=A0A8K0V291_9AGAR|nr:hypothetical protein BXZ70DRAFT_29279 [Cristinia sonorae]
MDLLQTGGHREGAIMPIACRLVPTDQWLVTHIDCTWKVKHLKLFLLAKFFPSSFISTPHLPRVQTSSKRRAVSPIRFAAQPQLSPTTAAQVSDGENGYGEEEEDFGDEIFTQFKWTANMRKSTPVVPMIAKPETAQATSEDKSSGNADPALYTLLSFSTGQILEDHLAFEWFNLNPHELLELHSAGFFVSLPKSVPDHYVLPYFEAPVWALRAISRNLDSIEAGSKKGESMENSPYGSDDRGADPHSSRREKLAKKRQTKLEWRTRWAVVHKGLFKLCKSRDNPEPTHVSSLSSLAAIRGAEHLSITHHAPSSSNSGYDGKGKGKDRPASKFILSIKFHSEKSARHLQPRPSVTDMSMGGSSGWWRRGSSDHGGRKGSNQDSDTMGDSLEGSGDGEREERSHKEPTDGSDMLILDMLTEEAFQHILRLFHLHAPVTVHSSFFPASRSPPVTESQPGFAGHLQASLDDNFVGRAPSPISFASRPPSVPSSPSSSRSLLPSFESESILSPPLTEPLEIPTEIRSVKYPEWRKKVVERARRAGVGFMDTAISHHVFGDCPPDVDKYSPGIRDRTHMHDDTESFISGQLSTQTLVEGGEATVNPWDEDDLLYPTGVLDQNDTDSSDDDDTGSEVEWEGWANGVRQRREEIFTKLKEEREMSAIRWDSNWTWNGQQDIGDDALQTTDSMSISPRANQASFMIPPKSTDPVQGNKSHGRSVTSYASADSLFKRTITRGEIKRSGSATVVGRVVRTDPHSIDIADPGWRVRPRSPLSSEHDDEYPEDVLGYEPRYTFATPPSSSRSSGSRHQQRLESDSSSPFHSYLDSSQRMPMSMAMTTISSVVSVGGREVANSKKKEAEKTRSRRSVLTAYSAYHGVPPFGHDYAGSSSTSSRSAYKAKSYEGLEQVAESQTESQLLKSRTKPKLTMQIAQLVTPSPSLQHPAHVDSDAAADLDSPRFASPEAVDSD